MSILVSLSTMKKVAESLSITYVYFVLNMLCDSKVFNSVGLHEISYYIFPRQFIYACICTGRSHTKDQCVISCGLIRMTVAVGAYHLVGQDILSGRI